MDNNPDNTAPDDDKIEELLSSFKPQPTARFYQKMSAAPWQKPGQNASPRFFVTWKTSPRWIWGTIAALLLLVALVITFIPQAQSIARQIYYSFLPSPSSQINVQVTLASPGDLFHFADPENFSLSVSEAGQLAGFQVKELSSLPEGLSFIGVRFDPSYDAATSLYSGLGGSLFLIQRPTGSGEDVFSIGPDAQVKIVQVGEVQGEYVLGGWRALSTQTASTSPTQAVSININATWDNSLPQSTLRWQSNDMAYELRTLGGLSLSLSQLITLANGVK